MEGYVYVLINASFPDLVKIGRTIKDPKIRAAELSATGTPDKFVVAHQVFVKNCVQLEQELHDLFSEKRHSNNREFFRITVHEVILALNKFNIKMEERPQFTNVLLYVYKINGTEFDDTRELQMPSGDFRIGYVDLDKLGFDIHTDVSEERNESYLKSESFKNLIFEYYNKFNLNCSISSMTLVRHDEFQVRTYFLEKIPSFLNERIVEEGFYKDEGFKIDYDGQTIICPKQLNASEMADWFSSDIFIKFSDEEVEVWDLEFESALEKINEDAIKDVSSFKGKL